MLKALITAFGRFIRNFLTTYLEFIWFFSKIISTNLTFFWDRLSFRIFVKELYVNLVRNFFYVIFSALILGSLVVNLILNFLINLNSYDRIGEFIVVSIFHVLSPFVVALILLMRSAVRTLLEVATFQTRQELNTFLFFNVSPQKVLFFPKLLAFGVSALILNFYFIFLALIGGYVLLGFLHDITYENYLIQIINYLSFFDVLRTSLKVVLIGFFMASVSIKQGLATSTLELTAVMRRIVNMSLIVIFTIFIVNLFL